MTVQLNNTCADPGYTAIDTNNNQNITDRVTITGTVDTSTAGT